MAGDLQALFCLPQVHPVLPLGPGVGQQGKGCLQGFVPHREGQGGIQGVGDFPPRRRDGVAAVGLLDHIALGHQRGQGVLRLKIVGQALFLDDARQVLRARGAFTLARI